MRRRGLFGGVAEYYAATSPNSQRQRILTDCFNTFTVIVDLSRFNNHA